MARSRYRVLGNTPHFVTCSVVEWIPLFSQPELVAIVLDALRFLQQEQRLTLHSYVVMENHLHRNRPRKPEILGNAELELR